MKSFKCIADQLQSARQCQEGVSTKITAIEVTFDVAKIENAIRKANMEVPEDERLTEPAQRD